MNDETNINDVIHNLQQTVESLVKDTNTIRELSSLQHVMITPNITTDTATNNNTSDINNNDNLFVSSIVAQMSSIDSVLTTLETKMKSLSSFIQDEKQAIRILNDKSNVMMEQYDIINDIFQVCFDRGNNNDDDDDNDNGDDLESSDAEDFYDVNDFDDHEEIDIIVDDDHEEEVEMYNDHDKRRRRRSSGVHHDSLPNFDDDDDDNYLRKTTEELERLELEQNNKENPKNNTNMNDNHNDTKLHNNKLRDATNKWLLNNQQRQEGQKMISKNNKMDESSSVVDDAVLEVDDNDNLNQTPTIRSRRRSSFSTNNNHPENDSKELQINKQYSNHQEQQQSVVIKLEPITKSEFENISKNTRGRMTLSTLNAALRDIQSCAQQKYNILSHHQNISPVSSGLSTPASYRQTLSTHEYYLSITELSSSSMKSNNNNTNTTPSKYSSSFQPYFISEQELRNDCLFFRKGESTARAILLTLRSAKRIKQVVGKKSQVCYVLL